MKEKRKYEEQNPWITFHYHIEQSVLWAKLGEAYSKCRHMAGIPLKPMVQQELARVYMVKGALASAAIEGNTLTEDQIFNLHEGTEKLPPSQRYLQQEVDNVIQALQDIDNSGRRDGNFELTVEWIKKQNQAVLEGLEHEEHVTPGDFTTSQMVVGNVYRGAPPEDIAYLYQQLCDWINRDFLQPANSQDEDHEDIRFYLCFLAAVLSHLYIAWIHGFGDGNGRTARLVETAILDNSKVVPWVSANTLADYYNETREVYYRRLSEASKTGDISGFILYSATGFVEKLRSQIARVQEEQRQIAWESYVSEQLHNEPAGTARDRRRDVALAMSQQNIPLSRQQIVQLNTTIAAQYGADEEKRDRMVTRDLNALTRLGLVIKIKRGSWAGGIAVMDAFKPR